MNRGNCREVEPNYLQPRLNLSKLGTGSLWRYWRKFNLTHISANPTKEQLLSAVQQHFSSQRVDEVQVVVEFIRAAKRLRCTDTH
ncbi:unnamed protein product [Withania somnifera]